MSEIRPPLDEDLIGPMNPFADLHVLVIGDAMLDSYLEGFTNRLCREAPVPVVTVTKHTLAPGGAANTAVNVASLGARVTFLSVVGDDQDGERVRRALEERGVPAAGVLVDPARETLAKHRIVAASQMLVRYDLGSTEPVGAMIEQQLVEALASLFVQCDAVIVSDYGYGVCTPAVIETLARLQAEHPRVLVADSKELTTYSAAGVTAVKPNYGEAVQLLGLQRLEAACDRVEQMLPHGERILALTGAEIAAVTLDSEGALVFERGSPPYRTYAQPNADSRAAGAGDTFVSALALALAAGARTPGAAELASAAATIVVEKEGTTACSAAELWERLAAGEKYTLDPDRLAARLALYREQCRRIVFTNGCFDILHSGHISYLNQAKALGDILIVGVNTDDSVRRLKGTGRPINSLADRIQVLSALSSVDHIIAFAEDTPSALIRAIRPDVFVKGGDYTRETLPEAALVEELGGEIHILPYLEARSTTSIIERIRQVYAGPTASVGEDGVW